MITRDALPLPEMANLQDMRNACRIWAEGHKACEQCNGTGNQLFAMYQTCETCGGSGIAKDGTYHYVATPSA